MARKKSLWKHKTKFPGKYFKSFYDRTKSNSSRVLVLNCSTENSLFSNTEIFESHEKAKAAGWEILKQKS